MRGRFKAVLIGVVSRGMGCTEKNSPAVFTRVKRYLKWIFHNTKNDNCNAMDKGANPGRKSGVAPPSLAPLAMDDVDVIFNQI